jgi:transcriptional regulator with XRE-family HTH domain
MIESAPVHAGDVLDWLHEQGKQRAQEVPEFDVEETLHQVRAESQRRATEQDQFKRDMRSNCGQDIHGAVVGLKTTQPQRHPSARGLAAVSTVAAEAALEVSPQPLFDPRPVEPTVRRLVLGTHLRRLREDASITVEQAAAAIRGSHSKISRMEHGQVGFKERDIADLLTLYGVTGAEERQALLKLAREANTPGWWQGYSDILPHWVKPYLGLEAAAALIRNYAPEFVPALLQTESYARTLMRLDSTTEDDVRRRAEARLYRQEILRRATSPRLWAVMDEAALRRSIGGRSVMREQIRHLIHMCDHPAVTLQILPFQVGAHAGMGGPFTILRFSDPALRDVVYIEQLTSAIYLDKPAEVDCYLDVIEQLCIQAVMPDKTPEMLRNILAET